MTLFSAAFAEQSPSQHQKNGPWQPLRPLAAAERSALTSQKSALCNWPAIRAPRTPDPRRLRRRHRPWARRTEHPLDRRSAGGRGAFRTIGREFESLQTCPRQLGAYALDPLPSLLGPSWPRGRFSSYSSGLCRSAEARVDHVHGTVVVALVWSGLSDRWQ